MWQLAWVSHIYGYALPCRLLIKKENKYIWLLRISKNPHIPISGSVIIPQTSPVTRAQLEKEEPVVRKVRISYAIVYCSFSKALYKDTHDSPSAYGQPHP